jgi:hypothetical protein
VSENRVLRIILGPKRDEMRVDWRKLHNNELHNLMKSRRVKWAGHVTRMEQKRKAYRILIGKARRKDVTRKTKTYVRG